MAEDKPIKRGHKFKDLTGQRFGRLIVVSYAGRRGKASRWACICDCGTEHIVNAVGLTQGTTRSCGCLAREMSSKRVFKHGLSNTRESKSWTNARLRCLSPNNKDYKHYGARGITMCPEWADSFERFLADMGPCPPGMTLDRIDNELGYSKDNCRWATHLVQSTNQRRNILITHNGVTHNLREWSDLTGILYGRIYDRYKHGKPLFEPVTPHKPYRKRKII